MHRQAGNNCKVLQLSAGPPPRPTSPWPCKLAAVPLLATLARCAGDPSKTTTGSARISSVGGEQVWKGRLVRRTKTKGGWSTCLQGMPAVAQCASPRALVA